MKRYSATLLMAGLGLAFLVAHFITGWVAYVDEAATHGEAALWSGYLIEWSRDVTENLQSEFIQLAFQMALLAGILETIRVTAYARDNEEIKQTLARIEFRQARDQKKVDRVEP